MRKIVVIFLALQLLLVPAAGFGQETGVNAPQPEKSMDANISVGKGPKLSLEKETDYLNPTNYPLIDKEGFVDDLWDSYGGYQTIFYKNIIIAPNNSDDMNIKLLYYSQNTYEKASVLTVEFYKEEAVTLQYVGNTDFNTAGLDSGYLNAYLPISDFNNQPYIYMRIGISENSSDAYYSDVISFKVANPFYSASRDKYAVISNESTDGLSSQSTGTFNLKNMNYSMDKSLRQTAYRVDVVKHFDIPSNGGKLAQKKTSLLKQSYHVGDNKNFWVSNLENNSDYQIDAKLAFSGSKANVWVNNNQISDLDAVKLGEEFDNKIYSSVTNYFGKESDIDKDGKINILCFDIQDGFTGNGGYVAGYFWARDLYDVSNSNKSEIFYIDSYPTMGSSTTKDVTSAYEILAHEFQHMVNYNQNVLIEGTDSDMDTWLNEGLSMAAEEIYSGHGLIERVAYYNVSSSIENGHSLLFWDDYGDVLSNYALSYLFMQYIKIQTNQGDRIFKEILNDSNNNYVAIENVVKKYISPDMTFGKFMTDFRIALLLKEPTGLYGFNGEPFFDSLEEKIFNGNSANLRGGGSIVTSFNSEEGLVVPATKGPNVNYTFLDVGQGGGEVDITPPVKPTVNEVTNKSTGVTGKAEAGTTVEVKANGTVLGSATVGEDGQFTIAIPLQKAGTELIISSVDTAGNRSETNILVKSASLTGWIQSEGKWFFYDSVTFEKVTGWKHISNTWYYFDAIGEMVTGWLQIGGTWYYFEGSGAMETGWLQSGATWYFFEVSGAMKTGWLQSGATWYYFEVSGAMKTGWLQSGATWYYFYNSGSMAYNTIVNGSRLGSNGAWIR